MDNSDISNSFKDFGPDIFIEAVEDFLDKDMTSFSYPLNSYINRVYELQALDGTRFVAKFYRPGRWSRQALIDEHNFVLECEDAEIPVISPIKSTSSDTLGEVNGVYFTVFPKRFGRNFEICTEDDWKRIGGMLGRLHNVGTVSEAKERIKHHPLSSTKQEIDFLREGWFVTPRYMSEFNKLSNDIINTITDAFDNAEFIRTHGDCHAGNILHRPDEGIMFIDFDDMMTAPPVQDLWLILPDRVNRCKNELDLLLKGYRQFRKFDTASLKLIEPLRIMRMIYFLSWCAKQEKDFKFKHNFPHWGSESYWREEINDLHKQLEVIKSEI